MRFFKRNRSLSDIEKQLLEASKGDDHTKHEEEISEQDHFAKSTNFLGRMIGKTAIAKDITESNVWVLRKQDDRYIAEYLKIPSAAVRRELSDSGMYHLELSTNAAHKRWLFTGAVIAISSYIGFAFTPLFNSIFPFIPDLPIPYVGTQWLMVIFAGIGGWQGWGASEVFVDQKSPPEYVVWMVEKDGAVTYEPVEPIDYEYIAKRDDLLAFFGAELKEDYLEGKELDPRDKSDYAELIRISSGEKKYQGFDPKFLKGIESGKIHEMVIALQDGEKMNKPQSLLIKFGIPIGLLVGGIILINSGLERGA